MPGTAVTEHVQLFQWTNSTHHHWRHIIGDVIGTDGDPVQSHPIRHNHLVMHRRDKR